MIIDLFKNLKECQHSKVSPDQEKAYCPDCGAYVETKWYLPRCKCCNIKRAGYLSFGRVKPVERYCPNCGGREFYLEEVNHINFVDINFAVMRKVVVEEENLQFRSQIWVDNKENQPQGLLGMIGC